MAETPRILWLANQPTPQFTPVLNSLAEQFDIRAAYFEAGSGGRGWGDLDLRHDHTVISPDERGSFAAGVRFVRQERPDALVVFGYAAPFAMGVLAAARALRIPVVTQSDSDWAQEQNKLLLLRLAKGFFLRGLYAPKRTTVVAISTSNRAYWEHYGARRFVEIPFESPILAPAADQAGPDLPQRYVLFVGRLLELKRPADAIAAVARARRTMPDVELVIVGDGDLPLPEVPEWVHLHGSQPTSALGRYYAGASALVITSSQEAYGLVVREALQFGTPVVGYERIPAIAALCPLGWNQVVFADTDALGEALSTALAGGRWQPRPPVDTAPAYTDLLTNLTSTRRGKV